MSSRTRCKERKEGGSAMRRTTRIIGAVAALAVVVGSFGATPALAKKKKSAPGCDASGRFESRGKSWTAIKRPPVTVSSLTAYGIPYGLTVFSGDPNRMYAFSKGEIWGSTDGGCTWNQALKLGSGVASNMPAEAYYVRDVVVAGDSKAKETVYALIAGYRGGLAFENVPSYYVAKSTDGGKSWSLAQTGLPGAGYYPRLFIAPSDPDRLYLTSQVYTMAFLTAQLWVTKDGGKSWSQGADPTFELQRKRFFDVFYEVFIEVNPADPDDVWRFDGWDGLYRSKDGGASWSAVTGLTTPPASAVDFQANGVTDVEIFKKPGAPASVIVSILDQCEFNNSQDCSVFRSDDDGQSWYRIPLPGRSGSYKFGATADEIVMQSDAVYRFDKRAFKKGTMPWTALGPPGSHDYLGKTQTGLGDYKAVYISDREFIFRYTGRL